MEKCLNVVGMFVQHFFINLWDLGCIFWEILTNNIQIKQDSNMSKKLTSIIILSTTIQHLKSIVKFPSKTITIYTITIHSKRITN